MNISNILEIIIGVVVVYYVLSLIVSSINSQILLYTQQRAKDLKAGINELITDPAARKKFWESPLIKNLEQKQISFISGKVSDAKPLDKDTDKTPDVAYIPSATFAKALLKTLSETENLTTIQNSLKEFGLPSTGITDIEEGAKAIETWFDDKMLSVSSIYKQHCRRFSIFLAFFVTLLTGIDTIELVKTLNNSAAARAALATKATQILDTAPEASVQDLMSQLEVADLPLLWQNGFPSEPWEIFFKIVGLLITWAAVSLGSSFWYQILGKVRNVATTTSPPTSNK